MKRIVAAAADRLFGAEDTVCLERARLVTEAWRAHEGEPAPLLRAAALARVLEGMTLDLDSNPVFAGNTSARPRAWVLMPEYGVGVDAQVALEHAGLEGFLDGRVPDDLRAFWKGRAAGGLAAAGHLCVDWDLVVRRGLGAAIEDLDGLLARDPDGPERAVYRRAMRAALAAVVAWAHRYAAAAECAAAAAPDTAVAACHRRVAAACRHVPERPARNLFEGLQAIALVHLATVLEGQGMSISIGLPDRVLAGFAPEAESDPDAAADLVAAFLLKIASNSHLGRGSKTQAVTVGGAQADGSDACNAVTLAFLDGFDRVAVADPHLFLRWHAGLAPAARERAWAMLGRGRSMPLLVNDAPTVRGFVGRGIPETDAREYCVVGCNELGIPGRMFESALAAATLVDVAVLRRLLLDLPDPSAVTATADLLPQLGTLYEAEVGAPLAGRREALLRRAACRPMPLTTALMRGAPARGEDYLAAMPQALACVYDRGLVNAANALAAIDRVVFTERAATLGEVVAALRADWEGHESRRARLLAAPKWGNDDGQADAWMSRLLDVRRDALARAAAARGAPPPVVCHVVRSLHHLSGRPLGATPDGRRAGEPLADSVGAALGTAAEGPTAVLNSVLKLDAARDFAGGYNLNLTLATGQAAPAVVRALAEGFFAGGGQELQVNVLDAATLRAARAQPGRYRDLVVRVAGLSARFVELAPAEQDELIARAEAAVH